MKKSGPRIIKIVKADNLVDESRRFFSTRSVNQKRLIIVKLTKSNFSNNSVNNISIKLCITVDKTNTHF